jgi:hypothetical protein
MLLSECLEQLVTSFYRDITLARGLDSENPEDDLAVKAAVVGFCYNSPTQEWDKGHLEFIKSRLSREFQDDESLDYGKNSENVRLFYALALGYLLGLYQQDKIIDAEFEVAERQISGLIMLKLPSITAQPA